MTMEGAIGEAAGQIWQYLHAHGAQSFPQLQQGTRLSERLLSMRGGWLAREGHLVVRQERGVLKVAVQDARQP
jgi:Winged helix-turn-helix domain (DUF2582)